MYLVPIAVLIPGLMALAGFVYQVLGAHRDRKRYANVGRWITIGQGCKLYLLEKGSGSPTVLFESGIAATNLNWYRIQEEISKTTATVSYDRAGLGWSSPCLTPRTPSNIAVELHNMLQKAGIESPYVLVGHSFGGLVMRRYAVLYPDEVAGVVLVDPMRIEEWPPLDPSKHATLDRGLRMSRYAISIARFGLARLAVTSLLCRSGKLSNRLAGAAGEGGLHVLGRIKAEVGKMPREVWPSVAAHWSRPSYYKGMCDHIRSVPDTVREMQNSEPIRRIPVLLLTPGKSTPVTNLGMSQIGDNVQQAIAAESAHWIHLDQPDVVIRAIRDMVQAAKVDSIAATV